MKNLYNKIFSSKKSLVPYFVFILVFEALVSILSMMGGERHIIIMSNAILLICLAVTIFITNHFKKYKATRVFITLSFFVEAIVTTAYSFMAYPKAPSANVNFVGFVFYILYACCFAAMFLCAIMLHVNTSKKNNANTLFALYIIQTIVIVLSLVMLVGSFINWGRAGFTYILLSDIFGYVSFALMGMYFLTNENLMLPEVEKELKAKTKR